MKEVAGMLKRRFANIITYLKHRITNAASESINAKIQWVKYTARGFRNKQNFINAIYFHCGGLDLAPHPLSSRIARTTFTLQATRSRT
jgi:transposase